MRTGKKLILVVFAVMLCFTFIVLIQRYYEIKRLHTLYNERKQINSANFSLITELMNKKLESYVIESTYWDELVKAVETKDSNWFHLSIGPNFAYGSKYSGVWIFNNNKKLVFSTGENENGFTKEFPVCVGLFDKLIDSNAVTHFFILSPKGFMEINGAKIYPGNDPERKNQSRGYFFAGKLWDADYISQISSITTSNIAINYYNGQSLKDRSDFTKGKIYFIHNLCDWSSKPIASVHVLSDFTQLKSINKAFKNDLYLFLFFAITIVAVLMYYTVKWVSRPLNLVSQSLKNNEKSSITGLTKDKTEFGDMARLIENFYLQQRTLQDNEQKYRMIFDTANDSIFLMQKDKFIDCNEKTLELFGCTREQIINTEPYRFSPPTQPDGRDSTEKAMERIIAAINGQPQRFEWVHSKYDKSTFDAEVSLNAFKIADEHYIQAIVRDISEQKKAEDILRKSRETLTKIIDSMPFAVTIVDKKKNIRLANSKAVEMTGYKDSSELVGKMCHKFICPAECGNCPVLDKHMTVDMSERVVLTKDGKNVPVLKSVVPIMFEEEEVLLESFVNITERKEAEEKTKQLNQNLESVNDELKNFVYVASHDLREPLRKITAFGSILQSSLKGKLDGDDTENLQFMIDGAARMNKMIEGLLSYSRVNTKACLPQQLDLNDIVKDLREFELSVVLQEKQVTISVPEPLPVVQADSAQLHQLMQNLIANGIKYQAKGNAPKINITCKPAADDMVRIEVTDNGIGIKPEYHQSIFNMFKRLHTSNEYEGTGIGLAVCKKIVEKFGGQIGVESQFGQGTTFWFTIPAVKVGSCISLS